MKFLEMCKRAGAPPERFYALIDPDQQLSGASRITRRDIELCTVDVDATADLLRIQTQMYFASAAAEDRGSV